VGRIGARVGLLGVAVAVLVSRLGVLLLGWCSGHQLVPFSVSALTTCRAGRSLRRSFRAVPAVSRATSARLISSVTVGHAPWRSWCCSAALRARSPADPPP